MRGGLWEEEAEEAESLGSRCQDGFWRERLVAAQSAGSFSGWLTARRDPIHAPRDAILALRPSMRSASRALLPASGSAVPDPPSPTRRDVGCGRPLPTAVPQPSLTRDITSKRSHLGVRPPPLFCLSLHG